MAMTRTLEIKSSDVTDEELTRLEIFAEDYGTEDPLGAFLLAIVETLRSGGDVVAVTQ